MNNYAKDKTIKFRSLIDNRQGYETVEEKIKRAFKLQLYLPLVKALQIPRNKIFNSKSDLLDRIRSGQIEFHRGHFSGRFNAASSKELKAMGAKWDKTTGTFRLPLSSLDYQTRAAIEASETAFTRKMEQLDEQLSKILPEKISDSVKVSDHFDAELWRVEKDLNSSLKGIVIAPILSKEQKIKIANEWEENLRLDIKKWTADEIIELRRAVQTTVFAGKRNESREKIVLKILGRSHEKSVSKAKFLASQETRLLMSTFKESRYLDAGVEWYEWGISNHPVQPKGAKPKPHEVRHDHGVLAGKYFRWSDPPITDSKTGAKNNPGQDYNCRCHARPVINPKGVLKSGFGCTYMEAK